MQMGEVEIEDTFAEAFEMYAARALITAKDERYALISAVSMTGFATSVIMCGCEAGIENEVSTEETPDGRPGINILIFAMSKKDLEAQLFKRVSQCVLTSVTTACFNNLNGEEKISIGGKLKYFGDGHQVSRFIGDRRMWVIPVMEGEFAVEEEFGILKGVGGGNFLILGRDIDCVLEASEKAVEAIKKVKGVIAPFPGGIVRSGSKIGSRYEFLNVSTNTAYCPTLKSLAESKLPKEVNSVLEIVLDGLDADGVYKAMREGIKAACTVEGILKITAGNYGGKLGKHLIHLREVMAE
ncbi:MAG: formylmethanofuran--tetrahydromethanopterin N-formyltransferase [Methanocellales archaeon]|nr:formylmethanofuran--tetrahydromethanopterin N-formyltransferase [Methanocellales archaeon]MDD3291456.1 formylmethanofuran--tetrahydromethanopterin N-formyltransferase [Methanocellales archaeon]MDD5234654.1 formylmethanofuran--tetrahydromethanopterin N-formyltransferase [Methanocellales archaeon]MDD5484993.1 formylmethanofuran--tetrahydromethanopterin N-formyltransferase [Methanocellales archaeon]